MPPLNLYARVRLFMCILHTRPRVQRAPGLPCALSWAEGFLQNFGRHPRRGNANAYLLQMTVRALKSCRVSDRLAPRAGRAQAASGGRSWRRTPRRSLGYREAPGEGTLRERAGGDSPSPQPSQSELRSSRPRERGEGAVHSYPSNTASAPFTASALSITVRSSEPACTEMFSAKNRASVT